MNKKLNIPFTAKILIALFVLFCIVSVITVQIQLNDLRGQYEAIVQDLEDHQFHLEELQYELSLPEDEYIIRYARKNGFRMSGEITFVSPD